VKRLGVEELEGADGERGRVDGVVLGVGVETGRRILVAPEFGQPRGALRALAGSSPSV
jgi:hypothetical protein